MCLRHSSYTFFLLSQAIELLICLDCHLMKINLFAEMIPV